MATMCRWSGFTWIILSGVLCVLASSQEFGPSLTDVRLMPAVGVPDDEISLMPEEIPHHHLVRRQATPNAINLTFQLEKLDAWASDSTIKVGHKVPFKLTVWFDENGSTDLNIEVISQIVSDNTRDNAQWAPLSICAPEISSVGPNFGGFTSTDIDPIMSATLGDGKYDSAAIYFGDVQGSNIGVYRDDDKMEILFSVIVNSHPGLTDGDPVWVSAGAQYNNKLSVWIAQAVLTYTESTAAELESEFEPSFLLTGPDTLMKGAVGVWTLEMGLRDATNNVLVEVYAPSEGGQTMSVCRISVGHTGESYDCYTGDSAVLSFPDIPDETPINGTHTVALFDMSTLVNTKYWEASSSSADNNITLSIAAYLLNKSAVEAEVVYSLGVAVQVDSDTIWGAEILVEAREPGFDSSGDLPTVSMWTTEDQLTWNSIATAYVNVTIKEGMTDEYLLEVSVSENETSPVVSVEREPISAYYVGFNFPCWDSSSIVTSIIDQDYMIADLGLISNSAERQATSDSTIVLRVQAQVVATHPSLQHGDTVSFTAGLKIGATLIWIGSLEFIFSDPLPTTALQAPSLSVWNMMNYRDSGILYDHGSTAYILKLDLPAASFWSNLTVSVSSPDLGDYPAVDICGCEVYQSGRDIVYGHSNENNTYGTETHYERVRVPGTKEFVTSSYSLSFPHLGNAGYGNFWWATNDSVLYLTLMVRATENPLLLNQTSLWLNITVDCDDGSAPLEEDVALEYSTSEPVLSELDADPSYTIVQTGGVGGIRASGVAQYDINVVTTPRTIQDFSFEVFTLNDTISVCRVALRQKGRNIPCLREAHNYYAYFGEEEGVNCTEEEMSPKCVASQQDHGIYHMGKTPNTGQELLTNATMADNTFSVEVAVTIHENYTDLITSGDTYTLILGIFQGGERLYVEDVSVQAQTSAIPALGPLPQFEWYKMQNNSEITLGGSAVFVLDIYVPPESMATYRLEFFVPINSTQDGGKASVCDARVMVANWNLPCVNDSYLTRERLTLDSGATYDAMVLELGIVTNVAPDDGTYEIKDPENLLRVEVSVYVPLDSEAVPNDYLWAAATVNVNGDNIYVSNLPFLITDSIPTVDSQNDTDLEMQTNDSSPVPIGHRKRFSVDITTQIVMSRLTFNFGFPHDSAGETLLTLINPHVTFSGPNIACGDNIEARVNVSNSITSPTTSQDEDLEVDLGVITNLGTTTRYDFGPYLLSDDLLTLSFDIVPADNALNTDLSVKEFSILMTDSDGRTDTLTEQVTIIRDGTEEPQLQIANVSIPEGTQGTQGTDINQGDTATIAVHFNHTWGSSAHAHNVVVRLYIPDLLHYQTYSGFDFTQPTQEFSDKRVLSFTFPELFFSDNETFHTEFTFDPTLTLPVGTGEVHLVVPADIMYSSEAGTKYFTDLFVLEFDAFVPDCHEPLGLKSDTLQDCQMLSSVADGFDPDLVRLDSVGGWVVPGVRGEPFLQNDYLQFNFGSMKRITGFKIQPHADDTNFVRTLRLQYSNEGFVWFDYKDPNTDITKEFDLTTLVPDLSAVTEVVVELNASYKHAIEARSLRLIPLSSLNGSRVLSMRLELYGCDITDPSPMAVCPADLRKPVYERGYLLDENEGNLYVCMVSNIDDYIKCSYTEDHGASWEEISNHVININFMRRDTSTLYGLARNRLSRMKSDDGGDSWWTVTDAEYTEAAADTPNVILVKSLPFSTWPLDLESLYQEFGLYFNLTTKWTADVDGLHMWTSNSGNWQMVSYWADKSLN